MAEWDKGDSPVYADAMELARTLTDRGIVVECVLRSKEERRFEGQKGAAWYKTDHGIFEVWFLPKTESFAAFKVVEQQQGNGRYLYTFPGTPAPRGSEDSSKQEFFITHGNVLFKVWGDKQLAASLEQAFQKPLAKPLAAFRRSCFLGPGLFHNPLPDQGVVNDGQGEFQGIDPQ
jgi:hypothetical protein